MLSNIQQKTIKLNNIQKIIIDDCIKAKKMLVFADCGIGKTLSALSIIKKINKPCVVIAPEVIIRSSWMAEIKKWGFDFKYVFIKKEKDFIPNCDIYFHTPDFLNTKNYFFIDVNICIVDEASKFKNYNSQRAKSLMKISHKYKYLYMFTATPTPKGVINLFSLCKILDGGIRLGRYITHFRMQYYYKFDMFNYILKPKAQETITAKIRDIAKFYKTDAVNIPYIVNYIQIDLCSKFKHYYNTFSKDKCLILDDDSFESKNTETATITKLLQLSSGYMETTNGEIYRGMFKIKRLQLFLDDLNEQSCIIFYNFNHEMHLIESLLQKQKISYEVLNGNTVKSIFPKIRDKWNNKDIRVLLGNPTVCGLGLNLQEGGHNILWYSPTWDQEVYYQANRRVLRQGQKNTVIIHNFCSLNTIEESVYKNLNKKQINQKKLLNELSIYNKQ